VRSPTAHARAEALRVTRVFSVGYVVDRISAGADGLLADEIAELDELGMHVRIFVAAGRHAPHVTEWPSELRKRLISSPERRGRGVSAWIAGSLVPTGVTHLHATSLSTAWFANLVRRQTGIGYSIGLAEEDLSFARLCASRTRTLAAGADFVVVRTDGERVHVARAWHNELTRKVACIPRRIPAWSAESGATERLDSDILVLDRPCVPDVLPSLMDAVAQVRSRRRLLRATIISNSARVATVQAAVRLRCLEKCVTVLDDIGPAERMMRMRLASLLIVPCVPARVDGIGRMPAIAFEAARAGVPLLAIGQDEAHEGVDDGFTGRVISPGGTRPLTGAIETMLDQPDVSSRMARDRRALLTRAADGTADVRRLARLFSCVRRPQAFG
jgi:glycosyltransferase involved in cell wall biosynthesis